MARNGSLKVPNLGRLQLTGSAALKIAAPILVFGLVLLLLPPEGLSREGQRALAIMSLVVVRWATEALPIAVAGITGVVLLILLGAVPDTGTALFGFSHPVAYFLIGILTLGLAVHRSGLALRMATFLIRGAGGSPRMLYAQMLFSFAFPSASPEGPSWCTSVSR